MTRLEAFEHLFERRYSGRFDRWPATVVARRVGPIVMAALAATSGQLEDCQTGEDAEEAALHGLVLAEIGIEGFAAELERECLDLADLLDITGTITILRGR